MRAAHRRRRRHRQHVAGELELMPMINVFMAIIPLLLLSAAFVPVTVIQASLPAGAVADEDPSSDAPLELTVFIRREAYVIEAHGLGSRSILRPPAGSRTEALEEARSQLSAALSEVVAARPANREVRIVAEATTRYEEIVDVMDVARAAGLPEVALADAGDEAW